MSRAEFVSCSNKIQVVDKNGECLQHPHHVNVGGLSIRCIHRIDDDIYKVKVDEQSFMMSGAQLKGFARTILDFVELEGI